MERAIYHGQRHWWNMTPAGLWVDFTPRGFKQLVLVESPKVKVPEPAADEHEAMRSPAKRADELAMEVQCNGVALPTVSLTGKQLDGQDNAEPVSMLNACFTALDRALKAAAPAAGSPEEEAAAEAAAGGAGADDARAVALPPGGAHSMEPYHFSLREIRVPSKDPRVVALEAPSKPVCFTPARSFLQAGATTRVALRFFPVESKERCVCSRLSFSRPPPHPPFSGACPSSPRTP